MLICMVKTPFIWFCVCIWPDCSAERQWAEVHTFLLRIWRVRHFAKRPFSERNRPLLFSWKQSENSPWFVSKISRLWPVWRRKAGWKYCKKHPGNVNSNVKNVWTSMTLFLRKNRREIIEFHEIESKLCTECTKNYVKELTSAWPSIWQNGLSLLK